MPNKYFIIAIVLVLIALTVGSYRFGHSNGVDAQKIVDQVEFDRINNKTAEQKAEANTKYRALVLDKIALMVANEKANSDGAAQHAKDEKRVADLHAQYSGRSLRYGTAQDSGLRNCSDGAVVQTGQAVSGTATRTIVQLPDDLGMHLRTDVALASDKWLNWYRVCYAAMQRLECPKD